jgi:pimeloyl-ACP methyl ester carboxylesterase
MTERLHPTRRDATLRWSDGASHYTQLEKPEAFIRTADEAHG